MTTTTQDVHNLSSSSSHRLPTISAAEALQSHEDDRRRGFSTGVDDLDTFLSSSPSVSNSNESVSGGGLLRGNVYEVYGPPGSGKTALGIQVTASALHQGSSVVWIDTSHQLPIRRLHEVLSAPFAQDVPSPAQASSPPTSSQAAESLLSRLQHHHTPTLSHLLALFLSPSFPGPSCGLVVLDTVSTPFATAFSRVSERQPFTIHRPQQNTHRTDHRRTDTRRDAAHWASNRRWALMDDFAARVAKLAATANVAVLLLSQTSTKVRTQYGTLLRPALLSKGWLENIGTRLVAFRDFGEAARQQPGYRQGKALPQQQLGHSKHGRARQKVVVRYFGAVKHAEMLYEGLERVFPFRIEDEGIKGVSNSDILRPGQAQPPSLAAGKRKRDEVADSENEDEAGHGSGSEFDWIEDDPLGESEGPEQDEIGRADELAGFENG